MGRGPGPTSRGIVLVPLQATGRTTTGAAAERVRPIGVATTGGITDIVGTTPIGNHVVRLGTGNTDNNLIPGAQISADGKYVLMITNPDDTQDFRNDTNGDASNNTAFLLLENSSQVTVGMIKASTGVLPIPAARITLVDGLLAYKITGGATSSTQVTEFNQDSQTNPRSTLTIGITGDYYVYVDKTTEELKISTTAPTNAVARSANWAALAAQRKSAEGATDQFEKSWAYEDNASVQSITFNGVASNGDGSQYDNAGLSVTQYTTDDIGLVIDTGAVSYATLSDPITNPIVGTLAQAAGSSVDFDASFKTGPGEVGGGSSTGLITLIADVAANEYIPHSITGVTLGNQFGTNVSNIVNSPFSISYAIGDKLEATYSYEENIAGGGGTTYDTVMLDINNEGDTVQIVPNADATTITFRAFGA